MRRLLVLLMLFLCLLPASFVRAETARENAEMIDMEHYLLIGVDGWGLNEEGGARSDAIILVSLDYGRDRITFTSFARDSIVKPAYRKGTVKLNTLVRSEEGEQALIDYVEEAFGVPIRGHFVINFSGAVDVINAVGGVEIELSQDEADYVNYHAGMYDGYPLAAGLCRLNGAQALYYMRCRSLDNDFGRQGRQGKALRAMVSKLSGITPMRALMLVDDVLGMYRTDMPIGAQFELAMKAIRLREARVQTHSLPAEGTYRYGKDSHGASGLEFNLEANQALLRDMLGLPAPEPAQEEERAPQAS
ncbi:MAG: LCP family protein [Clostridia bacterium]|nr:LCP family protein [Clostridia bacterium]